MKIIITENQNRKLQFNYLNYLFDGAYEFKSKKYSDSVFWKKNDRVILELDETGHLRVLRSIWDDASNMFSLDYDETQQLMKECLEQNLKVSILNPQIEQWNSFDESRLLQKLILKKRDKRLLFRIPRNMTKIESKEIEIFENFNSGGLSELWGGVFLPPLSDEYFLVENTKKEIEKAIKFIQDSIHIDGEDSEVYQTYQKRELHNKKIKSKPPIAKSVNDMEKNWSARESLNQINSKNIDFIDGYLESVKQNAKNKVEICYRNRSGDKNSFKFSTNIDGATIEDNNTTGQDRLVRTSFQLLVHGYLIPKDVAREVTTRRIITENKIVFTSEVFRNLDDINTPEEKINAYHYLFLFSKISVGGNNSISPRKLKLLPYLSKKNDSEFNVKALSFSCSGIS
jgi:hypothetical protein